MRQPLLSYPGGRRESLGHGPDAGRAGSGASGDRAHRRLFATGAGTLRAAVRHPAGPAPQGAAAGRDRDRRGGQRLAEEPLHRRAQRPLRRRPRAGGLGLRPRRQGDVARDPLRRRGAHGRRRQHRRLERKAPATAGEPPAPAFRQGAGAGARVPRRSLRCVPRPASARRLRRRGSPPRPDCAQVWRRARGRQGQALSGALARILDRPCARRQFRCAGRDEETAAQPNKETAQTQPGDDRRSILLSSRAVRGFRPASNINPKTPHHALQKHDRLTSYGHSHDQTKARFQRFGRE